MNIGGPHIIFLHEVQGHHKGAGQENNNEDAKDDIGLGIVTKRCIAQVRQCGGCNQGANNRTEAGNHGNMHKNFAKRPARLFLVGRKFLVLDFAVFGFFLRGFAQRLVLFLARRIDVIFLRRPFFGVKDPLYNLYALNVRLPIQSLGFFNRCLFSRRLMTAVDFPATVLHNENFIMSLTNHRFLIL